MAYAAVVEANADGFINGENVKESNRKEVGLREIILELLGKGASVFYGQEFY